MATLVCPVDHGALAEDNNNLVCETCGTRFPVVNGVPVLLHEANSVFRASDYVGSEAYQGASGYGGSADRTTGMRKLYRAFARKLSEAPVPRATFDPTEIIFKQMPDAEILVIGSGERDMRGNVTYTDVAFAKNIACICDGHDLPFPAASFDAVFVESVLEHVCDPQRVVAEVLRVLRPDGFVYAETPFLQPVHMGAYDFTRFTLLGHRRLFRHFDELASGMVGGPAYAAIHVMRNLLVATSDRRKVRAVLRLAGLLLTYPLRYLDPLVSRTDASLNAGCAFYFLGRRRASPISDRDLIGLFRGA
ncbi:MAG: Methyltransferase domain protein [Rubritepida sp.]|nr:Methyltransferase domain protein [Rubritepida sp.]